ncbi:MAG: M24 family metallopeptidase [Inquilinus sp.]|nr:M24 family metallopeptidase [Inquilinus sp.]
MTRKIDPTRRPALKPALKPDGTPADNDRVEIGPTRLAFDEWAAAGITPPDLPRMRAHRLDRLAAALRQRDYGAVLMFDPLNIRFASDTTNMQLWNAHNPFRACFVSADGYMVLWDFKPSDLLTAFNPLVRETRGKASFFYFASGDRADDDARRFAGEIGSLMRRQCGGNRRLAVDKIQIHGLRALESKGLDVLDGEEVMEKARAMKGPDEIAAMRCAMHACESAMHEMQRQVAPGMTENDIWAILHAENIKRGGEWIETRILASGPRTNPWFQECGPRIVGTGELLAFDTDLIGCYGMCADISRTWFVDPSGTTEPTAEQKRLFREAPAQIVENMAVLAPGKSLKEITFSGRPLPNEFAALRYSTKMHGVGLCDEWPEIRYPQDWRAGAFDYALEPGMTLCVEAYIGSEGGADGVKLEDQVLITETGFENLTRFPFDERLLA